MTSQSYTMLMIDGREVEVSTTMQAEATREARLFDKTKRHELDPKSLQDFIKGATGFVLAKNNKLSLTTAPEEGPEGAVKHARNLQSQLKKLKRHFIKNDMIDVFTIVSPKDVNDSNELLDTDAFDLFENYQVLHITQVANSNAWFKLYCTPAYIRENMGYILQCLENNTEETLWEHCYRIYKEYPEIQQGGPLMFVIIVKQIQNSSETAIEDLLKNFRTLKISDIPGENVNEMVIKLQSVYDTLVGASTDQRDYVPRNFCQDVLAVLQTSSVPQFNKIFEDEVNQVTRKAARTGGLTEWPNVEEIFRMATNSYRDMHPKADLWCLPCTTAAFSNMTPEQQAAVPYYMRPGYACFNCEKIGHPLDKCTEPRDEARIKKNREAFRKAHPKKHKRDRRPKRITASKGKWAGRPLIRNKKGSYVIDTKKELELKREADSKDDDKPAANVATKTLTDEDVATIKAYFTSTKSDSSNNEPEEADAAQAHVTTQVANILARL